MTPPGVRMLLLSLVFEVAFFCKEVSGITVQEFAGEGAVCPGVFDDPDLAYFKVALKIIRKIDLGPIPQGIRLALLPRNGASQAALTFVDLDPELLLNDKDRMLSIFKREVGTAKDMESMHMTTLRGQDVYFMLDGKNATLKQFIDGVTRGEDARVVGEASARVFAVKDCDSPKNVSIVFRADNLIIDSSILGGAPAPANASDPPGQVPTMAQMPTSGAASFNPAAADQHQSSAASVLPLYYGVMSVLFYVSIFY